MIDTLFKMFNAEPVLFVMWVTGALFLSAFALTRFMLWLMDDKWSIEMDDFINAGKDIRGQDDE